MKKTAAPQSDNLENPTYLGKVRSSEPEQFIFITMQSDHSGIKRTSHAMTEPESRGFSRINGKPGLREDEIDSMIETARKHEA
jgi:hypothetical protein